MEFVNPCYNTGAFVPIMKGFVTQKHGVVLFKAI